MAGSNSNYSILVDVQLQEESIKKQLRDIQNNKDTKLKIGVTADGAERTKKELDGVTQSTKNLDNSTKDLMFTYQQYRQVLDSVINITEKMYQSVKSLDDAQTELKKVSDLQGAALDSYTKKLSESGKAVARTGKPNRSEPVCCDGKAAQRTAPKPLKALRALSLQHEDEICLSVIINNELVRKQKDDKDDSMVEKPKESVANNV